jgi:hypothetical protein
MAIEQGGTSAVTRVPGMMIESSPIVMPGKTIARGPI